MVAGLGWRRSPVRKRFQTVHRCISHKWLTAAAWENRRMGLPGWYRMRKFPFPPFPFSFGRPDTFQGLPIVSRPACKCPHNGFAGIAGLPALPAPSACTVHPVWLSPCRIPVCTVRTFFPAVPLPDSCVP